MLTACLDAELCREGIRVLAVHPGRLLTTAAAADADVEPRVAAEKVAAWIESVDRAAECRLHDLMGESAIPW
jgi:NAD(P)-dependent dehydrogenase (short-subunit alcohol dehydrogenase family)